MQFSDMLRLDRANLVNVLDIAAVAQALGVPLADSGDTMRCPAPDHADRNPSCAIFTGDDGKQRFKCHSCGERGDVIDLLRLVEDLTFAEALERCAELADEGLPAPVVQASAISPETLAEMCKTFTEKADADPSPIEHLLASWEAPYTLAWLRATFNVGVNERGSVTIPHYASGEAEPRGIKWRSGKEKGAVRGSRLSALYAEWRDCGRKQVVIVEGESDCWQATWILRDINVDVLALPSGVAARPTEEWVERLRDRDVVLMFDADDAGRGGLRRWTKALRGYALSTSLALLPEGDDVRSAGSARVLAAFMGAKSAGEVSGIERWADSYARPGKGDNPAMPISDFTLNVRRRIEIVGVRIAWEVNISGVPGDQTLTDAELNDPRSLIKWANRLGKTWTGSSNDTQSLYRLLEHESLFVPRLEGKRVAGWHEGAFVFPGTTIGTARHAFVKPEIDAGWEKKLNLAPAIVDHDVVLDLVNLHCPAVTTVLLGWMAAAPLRALCSTFPSLALMGSAGSGKTTLVEQAMQTFGWMGEHDVPTTISATTAHGVWGVVGSTNAIPVWFDEYRPGARLDGLAALDQAIRDGWNGSATLRGGVGENKSALVELKTRSPLLITGENAFTEQSHAERIAILTLDRKLRSPEALARLKARKRAGFGRAYLEWLVEAHREDKIDAAPAVDNRPEQVIAVCRWGWDLFRQHAREVYGMRLLPAFDDSLVRAEHKALADSPPLIEVLKQLMGVKDAASDGFVVWSEGDDVLVRVGRLANVVERYAKDIILPGRASACAKWYKERFPGACEESAIGGSVLRLPDALSHVLQTV